MRLNEKRRYSFDNGRFYNLNKPFEIVEKTSKPNTFRNTVMDNGVVVSDEKSVKSEKNVFRISLKPANSDNDLRKTKSKFLRNSFFQQSVEDPADHKFSHKSDVDDVIPDEFVYEKDNDKNILNFLRSRVKEDRSKADGLFKRELDTLFKTIIVVENENKSSLDGHSGNIRFRDMIELDKKSEEIINVEAERENKIHFDQKSTKHVEYFENPEYQKISNNNIPVISKRINFDGL